MSLLGENDKQAFLFNEIEQLIQNRRAQPIGYENIITIQDINPNDFINKLYKMPEGVYEAFSTLSPVRKAMLYPHLSIYRFDGTVGEYKQILINTRFNSESLGIYNNDSDPTKIFEQMDEISGVGIKRIVINNNPERESDVNIRVTVELFIENIMFLMHPDIRAMITVPFIKDNVNKEENRIKISYGWNVPNDFTNDNDGDFKNFQDALKYSYKNILCELYRHDLSFHEDGSISLKLEYIAGLEGFVKSKQADLFNPENYIESNKKLIPEHSENLKAIKKLEEEIKAIVGNPSVAQVKFIEDTNKKIDEKKAQNEKYIKALITPLYGKILLDLMNSNNIYVAKFDLKTTLFNKITNLANLTANIFSDDEDNKKELNTNQFSKEFLKSIKPIKINRDSKILYSKASDEKALDAAYAKIYSANYYVDGKSRVLTTDKPLTEEDIEKVEETPDLQKGAESLDKLDSIFYFHLGDLVGTLIKTLKFQSDDFKFIFGTFDYVLADGKTIKYYNFSDIPIDLYSFIVYWNNYVISAKPSSYLFSNFIRDLFKDFIGSMFGATARSNEQSRLTTYTVGLDIVNSMKGIEAGNYNGDDIKVNLVTPFEIALLKDRNSIHQYMIVTARSVYNEYLNADYASDVSNGIYHYRIAQTEGIINSISFSKVDNQKLYDARMVNQKLNMAGNILKEHYDVNLTSIGNPMFQNGKYFYLDPSYSGLKFGKIVTETIGLGGYYFIHGVEDVISADGTWVTSVTGRFHSEPSDGNTGKLSLGRQVGVAPSPINNSLDPSKRNS